MSSHDLYYLRVEVKQTRNDKVYRYNVDYLIEFLKKDTKKIKI